MCQEMHTGITENRQFILADRKAASTTRVNVSHLRERIEKIDRSIGAYIYESTTRFDELNQSQASNTKLFEEFSANLQTQLAKMVE